MGLGHQGGSGESRETQGMQQQGRAWRRHGFMGDGPVWGEEG